MAKNGDITVQILREIRGELRKTREDLSARIDKTNARRHGHRGARRTLGDVKKLLQERREMGERVFRCEKDITKIKRHMRLS